MKNKDNIPQFVNSDSFMADKNYVKWLSDLKKRFRIAQLKAAVKVNTEMLKFYWIWARTFARSRSNTSGAQTS